MDYLKIYNHFYNKTFNTTKQLMISRFKRAKAKNRPFHNFANDVGQEIRKYRIEKFENVLKEKEAASFNIFLNKHDYVEGDCEAVIKQVLEEEVFNNFKGSNKYTYTHFIADLAIEDSLKEIGRHYHNHYSYYQLIYEQDRYDYFYLKDFNGGNYENSDEYQELLDVKYPNRKLEREKAINPPVPMVSNDSKEELTFEELSEIEELKSRLDSFGDDEKLLLLHIMYKHRESMKIPEFLRLHIIAGGLFDVYIFRNKNYNNKAFYKKVEQGVDYSKSYNLNFVLNLKSKLSGFTLTITKSILKSLEDSLR